MTATEYKNKLLEEFDKQRKMDRSKHFNEEQLQLIDKVYGLVIQTINMTDEEE